MKSSGPYTFGPGISSIKERKIFKSFCLDQTAQDAAQLALVNRHTAERLYRVWREKIYTASRRAPRFFGEVEMDQKTFGGRGRKRMQQHLKQLSKRLPHAEYMAAARKVRAEHKVNVFGILHRGGDVYVHIIKKADKNTLMPIIRLVVEQKSTVYTDSWRGFTELRIDGYTHKSVNHSIEYTNRKGDHINGIESFWSFAGRRLAKFNGISTTTFPLHLKECEFRYNHKEFEKEMKRLLSES